MSTESLWTRQEVGIRREISADAQPLVRPERPTAALLGSRRASRAGARSTRSLGIATLDARQYPCYGIDEVTMDLTAVLTPAEEGGFVALNPETGTTTQGETVEEAIANLREATALYLAEFPLETKGHPLVTMFSVPENA